MKALKRKLKSVLPRSLWIRMAVIYRRIISVPYRMDMFLFPKKMSCYCPCCKLKFRSFIEGGFDKEPDFYYMPAFENVRQDLKCPYCESLPRHRILAHWSETHKDVFKDKSILYFAPEKSMIIWLYNNRFNCTCADLDGKTDIKLDIQKMDLPDNSYDIIICNHVLEHVDDYKAALKDVYRVLRPGGSFICSFPMDPDVSLVDEDKSIITDEERLVRYGQSDHKRIFGMRSDELIAEAGFDVSVINGDDCPSEMLPVIGPSKYDINRLFRCVKPI